MKQTAQRIFGLDIFRALAILFVLNGHMWSMFLKAAPDRWVRAIAFNGVNVFFVLSGYLIGNILFKTISEKGPSFANLTTFWRDRWLRTLPEYYCVLIALMTIVVIYTNKTIYDFRYLFFFSENINGGSNYNLFTESWSLAVEEWFYLLIPVMLFVGANKMPLKKVVPIIILIVFLFSNAIRVYRVYRYGMLDTGAVFVRIDNILFGILGAWLSFYQFKIWTNYRNFFFVTGMIGYLGNHFYKAFSGNNLYNILLQPQIELLFILMTFPKIAVIKEGKGAIARIITFISTISYSIYLLHLSIFMYAVDPRFPDNPWILIPVYFIWAIGGGYLLYSTVEKWGLKYRNKLRQRAKDAEILQKSRAIS